MPRHLASRRPAARGTAFCLAGLGLAIAALTAAGAHAQNPVPARPILFAAQVPVGGFGSMTSTFGNHLAGMEQAPRGGDLVIRYPDGALRFLTREAGFGNDGMQLANAIAVREPSVHWSGEKALFSMVVGAPTQRYQWATFNWQIYEVSGLAQGATATIRKIAGQPAGFNNVSPIYATDGRILFTSDRPPSGAAHHYPQLDEYESSPTVAGIYGLDEASGVLTLLEHAPSGAFSLSIDSFGRVIFTKWDHLQRDQQGDAPNTAATYQAFTYANEAANATTTTSLTGAEVFPEPRTQNDPAYSSVLSPHRFNHFFPWEMNEDGTAEETLNHIGRQELGGSYTEGSFAADPNLSYYTSPNLHANRLRIGGDGGLLHFREDPTRPGDFLTTNAPEFATASGGTLMRLTGAPSVNAESMVLTAVTPSGADAQVPAQTGYFRNPLPMTDGSLVAVHTPASGPLTNLGSTAAPNWSFAFRLKQLTLQGGFWAPGAALTGSGIQRTVSWWTPDVLATHSGVLWELDPVEVVARPVPAPRQATLPAVEAGVFGQAGVDVGTFRNYLKSNGLALIVTRNVTQRDRADRQQPFNLRVPGGVSSIGAAGTVYDVGYLQIFQADAVRGYGNPAQPKAGRRLLARPMHAPGASQVPGGPSGAVAIATDGSVAALVPAQRALSWQLTDPAGGGVVRERNWISFQSGEIRVCGSCHGVNTQSQTGLPDPSNPPAALESLLAAWKAEHGGETVPTTAPTNVVPTAAPTLSPVATATRTATSSPATATRTATLPATATRTATSSPATATRTATLPATATRTRTSTATPTRTRTPTKTPTRTATRTATAPPTAGTSIELTAVRDTWIDQANVNQNKGDESALRVRPAGSGGKARRTLVAFDLASIPAGSCVSSARLRLRLTGVQSASRSYGVHRLTEAWTEGRGRSNSGATWRTRDGAAAWTAAGGSFVSTPTASTGVGRIKGATIEWNVTADVATFLSGSAQNQGWLIKDGSDANAGEFRFASREHGTAAARPRLVVVLGACR
jgi:hypothetical protein